jgi:uncharacterized protein DUF4406
VKVYLAGAMRGIPEFGRPAFLEGARLLRAAGHEVFSPVEHDEGSGFIWAGHSGDIAVAEAGGFNLRKALGDDLAWICAHADAVVLLPGWEKSRGACAEAAVARALDLPVAALNAFLTESAPPAAIMNQAGTQDALADLIHDAQCTRPRPCGYGQAGNPHDSYYRELAGTVYGRLEPEIGAANVLIATRVILQELW